jgi:hypothetical protein
MHLCAERCPQLREVPHRVLSIVQLLLQIGFLDGQTLLRHVSLSQGSLIKILGFFYINVFQPFFVRGTLQVFKKFDGTHICLKDNLTAPYVVKHQ